MKIPVPTKIIPNSPDIPTIFFRVLLLISTIYAGTNVIPNTIKLIKI
jgi:hypothetical protein